MNLLRKVKYLLAKYCLAELLYIVSQTGVLRHMENE